MKTPFPFFGGKRKVAAEVWSAIGDVDNYVESFAGSLAVLLNRPANHKNHCETVNDKDAYIANFFRAVKAAPDEVARWADNQVNETDLLARHIWLVNESMARLAKLEGDPNYFDAKVAGWWVWGIACWIGSGWCSGNGPWTSVDGVCQRPHLGDPGRGVNRQRPHLGDPGQGVNRKRPHLGGQSGAMPGVLRTDINLVEYMRALAVRLQHVRVCCGDWSRVVTEGALAHGETVGIFLDPPYDVDIRSDCYRNDAESVGLSLAVRDWAVANGDNPRFRIALCGYDGEHTMPDSWRVHAWKANRAYGNSGGESANNKNRHKERIWFSSGCVQDPQGDLFNDKEAG